MYILLTPVYSSYSWCTLWLKVYTQGKPLNEDFLMTIISHLKQEGANEETGEIPRGVKTRVSDMLKIDLHCVARAWSKWLTEKKMQF